MAPDGGYLYLSMPSFKLSATYQRTARDYFSLKIKSPFFDRKSWMAKTSSLVIFFSTLKVITSSEVRSVKMALPTKPWGKVKTLTKMLELQWVQVKYAKKLLPSSSKI